MILARRLNLADQRGAVALLFALALPALAVLAAGAIDLSFVLADKSACQDAADSAALNAAKQLGMTSAAGINAQADQFVKASIPTVYNQLGVRVSATVPSDSTSVTVALAGNGQSFFGNLLPPGG